MTVFKISLKGWSIGPGREAVKNELVNLTQEHLFGHRLRREIVVSHTHTHSYFLQNKEVMGLLVNSPMATGLRYLLSQKSLILQCT